MSDQRQKGAPGTVPEGPPRLERVPAGSRSPGAAQGSPPSPAPAGAAPPAAAPGASRGLAAREVGADAAIAAGIAHEGTLAREGPLRLFGLAAALQATGRLTLSPEGETFALSFRRGTVEHAASSDPGEDLGTFLVRKGAVTHAQRARAEASKVAAGGDLAAALIAGGHVKAGEVAGLLQEHGTRIVHRALAVQAGRWAWEPGAPPPPGAFPLGAPLAMLCAAVRALDAEALLARLGDRERRVASRVGGRLRLEDLRLTPQEARAASLFDGVRSPAELAAASPGDALAVLRMALLLGEVDLLAFGPPRGRAPAPGSAAARGGEAGSTPPAPRPPKGAPARPAAAPARTPAPAHTPAPRAATPTARPAPAVPLEKAALEALLTRLATADHFQALGLERTASAAQIKATYFRLAKIYHPDAVPTGAAPEVRSLCADVFAALGEAWSVLGEDASRAAYLESLRRGGPGNVDVLNIFRAEGVFEEGVLLAKARRYDEAIRRFDEAIRLNADEAEFAIWKAFCEFLAAGDKRTRLAPASAALEAALRRNPRCAQGYLFLGQMAKVAGELDLAERHLRRGLAVEPEHAELLRELKYLRR